MGKKKLTYVISNFMDGRDFPFEWLCASDVAKKYELSFILLNPGEGEFERHLSGTGVGIVRIPYGGKRDLPRAIVRLTAHFLREGTDIVHTHLFGGCMAGLSAAWLARVPKRLYTRHHSTINHDRFRHAVIYDRMFNALATDIVATCENGREVLLDLEQVPGKKIHVVNFGFRLDEFDKVSAERVERLRAKYGLNGVAPVIGVIAKYIEWKGVQYVIEAFADVLKTHPSACLVLANASGSGYADTIRGMLRSRFAEERYREILFEEDFMALYRLFDVFVHVPVDARAEAFGQVYVEALAAGVPAVFTMSGIAKEFIVHRENALVVSHRDAAAIARAVVELLGDAALSRRLVERGKRDVAERFPYQKMIDALVRVYEG